MSSHLCCQSLSRAYYENDPLIEDLNTVLVGLWNMLKQKAAVTSHVEHVHTYIYLCRDTVRVPLSGSGCGQHPHVALVAAYKCTLSLMDHCKYVSREPSLM